MAIVTSGKTGRAPSGNLRNFAQMSAGKFLGVYEKVISENNDNEAIQAVNAEASNRKFPKVVKLNYSLLTLWKLMDIFYEWTDDKSEMHGAASNGWVPTREVATELGVNSPTICRVFDVTNDWVYVPDLINWCEREIRQKMSENKPDPS